MAGADRQNGVRRIAARAAFGTFGTAPAGESHRNAGRRAVDKPGRAAHLAGMIRVHALFLWLSAMGPLMLLHACAGVPERPAARAALAAPRGDAARANDVLFRALGLVGTPYRYGGNTPQGGFDCSGLVGYVFRDAAGVQLPRASREIAAIDAPRIGRRGLVPGDLVFFGRGATVNHVGIYVGEGRFVHAPNEGGTVRLDALDGHYWKDNFLYARRVLR
jgi:cell wall-associated NlpC family hydrolase